MKTLITLLLFVLFGQTGSQPVNIPVPNTQFTIGYGAGVTETLTVTPQQLQSTPGNIGYSKDGGYTLTLDIQNHFPAYPGDFDAEIDFGTQKLCEQYGWGLDTVSQITITCLSPRYIVGDQALPGGGPVQGAQPLVLHFTTVGWLLRYNNIKLTFTPNQ